LTYRSAIPRFRAVSRIRVAVCFGVVISLLSAAAARAQAFRTASDGLNVGHFLLYPSISIEYTHDANITFESRELPGAEILASGVMLIKPRILMDLPIAASRIRWVYSPLYRDYTNKGFPQTRRFSHFFDFEATHVGPVLNLRASDHLVLGTVELQEVDRGGEAVFGTTPFRSYTTEGEVTLNVGANITDNVSAFVGYNFLWVSDVARPGDQIDRVFDPVGATRPVVPFNQTTFWAQGINFGVQLRY